MQFACINRSEEFLFSFQIKIFNLGHIRFKIGVRLLITFQQYLCEVVDVGMRMNRWSVARVAGDLQQLLIVSN